MHSLTSALDGGEWSTSRPGRFTPRERCVCVCVCVCVCEANITENKMASI
jgi:hypothetical protein